MLTASQAMQRLQEGNRRFVADEDTGALAHAARRAALVDGQEPFAIILSCSDSRVPAEHVLGQGLGDLFVIRVAGNIVAPSLVGSVEFAASRFGTRLVVVMGHTQCGAITATLEELTGKASPQSQNLMAIVNRVRPSVEPLMNERMSADELHNAAVRANVRASVKHLRHGSMLLERLIENNGLQIVGAEYSLETGVVDFFDT